MKNLETGRNIEWRRCVPRSSKSTAATYSAVQLAYSGNNQHQSILKDIETISLPNLKVLLLYSNEIESVEAIHRIHMPSLQELNLINNKLVCIKGFRKANWPNLNDFCFSRHGKMQVGIWCSNSKGVMP